MRFNWGGVLLGIVYMLYNKMGCMAVVYDAEAIMQCCDAQAMMQCCNAQVMMQYCDAEALMQCYNAEAMTQQ